VADDAERAPGSSADRRGLKFRRREDHAVELFHEALARLDDLARVDRILLELGRFYNPTLNAPIVDLPTRRHVMEALERADLVEARRLLDERLRLYARVEGGAPEPGE
jgi:hypothetical protein